MSARMLTGTVYLVVSKRMNNAYQGHQLMFEAFAKRPTTILPGEHVVPVVVSIDAALLEGQSNPQLVEVKALPGAVTHG